MATLSQNVKQAIHDFDSIKDAIEYKGVEIPEGAHTSEYAEKIQEIETGITPTGTISITENGTGIDVTEYASANVNVETYEAALANLIERDITSIDIPQGVTTIGTYAFSTCHSLAQANIPTTVTAISSYSFFECSLSTVEIPDGVMTIGESAFQGQRNSALTSVVIPDTVTTIGNYAFGLNSALTDIYYTGTQAQWESITMGNGAIPAGVTVHYEYTSD